MADNLQVPSNIEDKTVLKRFLTQLVLGINSNPLLSNSTTTRSNEVLGILRNSNADFLDLVSKLTELRTDILTYVETNLETIILQQQEDIAVIAEQFGTSYNQALAASWYGLSVKAGGAVAGLEVGSLDPDVTTPGDESSYFRVVADNFIVGRAYEDLTQDEKDYLTANSLPNFGTVYNSQKQPVPALAITWDSQANTYKHYFNGIVNFNNLSDTPDLALSSDIPTNISQLANDSGYSTVSQVNSIVDAVKNNLQSQIDGNITSWFYTGIPTLSNNPAINWDTTDIKNQHLGDLYYDKTSGYAYRFAYEDIVDSPDAGIIYSWIRVADTDITLALQNAADAQATADGKITTFYQASNPIAEGIGDLWIDLDNNNKMHIWNGTGWLYTRDTSKDTEIAQALQDAAAAQDTADGKIESFFQATMPSVGSLGDIWFDTDDGNKVYRYNGSSWVAAQDSKIAQALLDAADAQATADGKITTFYQTSTPTANGIGDLWIDLDNNNKMHIWNGTGWLYTRDTSKDTEIAQALQDAAAAQDTADGKIESFFQATMPSVGSLGDIWFDTDDGNKVYRYNGSSWVAAQDSKIAQALLDAADAQATADGKITTFYSSTQPSNPSIGDLWVHSTTNITKRWNSTAWVTIDTAKAINNGTTTISGGRIDTSILGTGVIYNTGANSANYTMKIDLNKGEIHIK